MTTEAAFVLGYCIGMVIGMLFIIGYTRAGRR